MRVCPLASYCSQRTETLLNTLRAAPLTLSTPPVLDAEPPPVGAATPLILPWFMVICPVSEVVVMDQLMLEDGDGGVCVSTTKVVGVPDTSDTSDGMIAVGRGLVAATAWLAVVGSAAARCAVVVMTGPLSPVVAISWPAGIASMSWARTMEPARASTTSCEAMVVEDGLVSVLEAGDQSTRVLQVSSRYQGSWEWWHVSRYVRSGCVAQRPSPTVEDGWLPVA